MRTPRGQGFLHVPRGTLGGPRTRLRRSRPLRALFHVEHGQIPPKPWPWTDPEEPVNLGAGGARCSEKGFLGRARRCGGGSAPGRGRLAAAPHRRSPPEPVQQAPIRAAPVLLPASARRPLSRLRGPAVRRPPATRPPSGRARHIPPRRPDGRRNGPGRRRILPSTASSGRAPRPCPRGPRCAPAGPDARRRSAGNRYGGHWRRAGPGMPQASAALPRGRAALHRSPSPGEGAEGWSPAPGRSRRIPGRGAAESRADRDRGIRPDERRPGPHGARRGPGALQHLGKESGKRRAPGRRWGNRGRPETTSGRNRAKRR